MHPLIEHTRREFLTTTANGLGKMALGSMLTQDGVLWAADMAAADPLMPKQPHLPAKAKNCTFIFREGAPSQMDLFEPKPKLNELNGQPLPDSMTKNVRFAFIKKETAKLMGSPRTFDQHRQSGMVFNELLPHMAKTADEWLMVLAMSGSDDGTRGSATCRVRCHYVT